MIQADLKKHRKQLQALEEELEKETLESFKKPASIKDLIEDRFDEMEDRLDRIETKMLSWWGLFGIAVIYFIVIILK